MNKIVARTAKVEVPKKADVVATIADTARAKRFTPKFEKKKDEAMTRADWDAKDLRISKQGAVQAAVIALAPVVSLEMLPEEAIKLATKMLEFVRGE